MLTNVYIDGFNLYYGALKPNPSCKWLDLAAFSKSLLLAGHTLKRVRYFTAPVRGAVNPGAAQRQQAYLRALRTVPDLSIHEGVFRSRPKSMPTPSGGFATVIKTEEKGSDVNLATYLLLDGFKKDAEVAIVISDDFDLKEPLRLARSQLGLVLGVASPRCHKWLAHEVGANFYRPIRQPLLATCQFPSTLQDATGQIQRPPAW